MSHQDFAELPIDCNDIDTTLMNVQCAPMTCLLLRQSLDMFFCNTSRHFLIVSNFITRKSLILKQYILRSFELQAEFTGSYKKIVLALWNIGPSVLFKNSTLSQVFMILGMEYQWI